MIFLQKLHTLFLSKKTHPVKKTILFLWAISFIGGLIFSTVYIFFTLGIEKSIHQVKEILFWEEFSLVNILFFLSLFVIRNIFFLPIILLLALGGALFGVWFGLLLCGIGEIIGATIGFFFARYYGREFFNTKKILLLRIIDKKVETHGFLSIFVLRLLPIVPFDLINFTAGISHIRFSSYFYATAISIWPDCLFYVLLGSSVKNPKMIFFAGILILFIVVFLWYIKSHPHFRKFLDKISKKKK
jgi:uncharacterized membrane protein YdjX (TVP38/TMEM64 family)